ncbi:DNA polymerase IV [Zavarzinia sp. CC-PAN008]|uniref:DNA polymerase IV n=1 Tax=Zavarzinia sp. CC-PAN008 TaxID=3243332 RepID=UPI003F74A09D
MAASLCRDCLGRALRPDRRCAACGSPRTLTHDELDALAIAHVDCDAFYAAVEKRDDPALRDRPLIIGGGRRGVVSTACYIARLSGVRSAMPMFKALKLCPEATVLRPDMAKYVRESRRIQALMRDLTPQVQPLSLDEAFLDLSGTERLHGAPPAVMLARLARAVEREVGITVSVGLSHAKFLAKIASEQDKPRGFAVIGRAETRDFLARQPVGAIFGVGRVLGARLEADGITTIGQLQALGESDLTARYGAMGQRLARLSRGEDPRRVEADESAKSISAETTFEVDLADRDALEHILWPLCEKVSARAKREDTTGRTVTLKLKTRDFRILTRQVRLSAPTQLAHVLFQAVRPLLRRQVQELRPGSAFRLIGVGLSGLEAGPGIDPADLTEARPGAHAAAERAIDRLRAKFGSGAVGLGRGLRLDGQPQAAMPPEIPDEADVEGPEPEAPRAPGRASSPVPAGSAVRSGRRSR